MTRAQRINKRQDVIKEYKPRTPHTPGPWTIGNSLGAEPNELPIYSDDRWLASAYANDNEIDSECESNARLIAAAPELLAFVRDYFEQADCGDGGIHDTDKSHGQCWHCTARRLVISAEGKAD